MLIVHECLDLWGGSTLSVAVFNVTSWSVIFAMESFLLSRNLSKSIQGWSSSQFSSPVHERVFEKTPKQSRVIDMAR